MAGDVDIAPAKRLLQAVCYPGHAALLHGKELVLSTGDPLLLDAVRALSEERRDESTFTFRWGEHEVCVCRSHFYTLIVVVPVGMDVERVHERMRSAIALYAGLTRTPEAPTGGGSSGGGTSGGGGSSGGMSGAPAELSIERVRPRPN